jgi:hypothetical protein
VAKRQQAGRSGLAVGRQLAKQEVSRQKAAGRQQAGGRLELAAVDRLSRGSVADYMQVMDIRTSAGI